tara:strand:- start:46748 stop:48670 length:1923 start_codon:yes stop_codon:yes gene_type:complete
MINPLISIAGGMVRAYNADTAAAKKQAYDEALIRAKVQTEADAANALIPKLYFTNENGETEYPLLNGKKINWDLESAKGNLPASLAFADKTLDIIESDYYKNLNPGDRARLNIKLKPIQSFVRDQTTKVTDSSVIPMLNAHDIMKINFNSDMYNPNNRVKNDATDPLNKDLIGQNKDGQIVGTMIPDQFFDRKTVLDYAESIIPHHSMINTQKLRDNNPISNETAVKTVLEMYGPAALETAANLTNLQYEVNTGRLGSTSTNTIMEKAYEYFPENTVEAEKERDAFFLRVISSAKIDNFNSIAKGYDTTKDEFDKLSKSYDIKGKRDLYMSTTTAFDNTVQMIGLVKEYQKKYQNRAVPLGLLGKGMGKIANFIEKGGGAQQLVEVMDLFKAALGIEFANDGTEERFKTKMGNILSDTYIRDVGEFRASYEVYQEFIAYQIAAALQGGTGGRTISDMDVKNIKASLGESLFQSGDILVHRLEEIGKFLNSINEKNRLFADAITVGDLKVAQIYREYVIGTKIARNYGVTIRDLDNVGEQGNYRKGELSITAVRLLNNLYTHADRNIGASYRNTAGETLDTLQRGEEIIEGGGDEKTDGDKGNTVSGYTLQEIQTMMSSDDPSTSADGADLFEDYKKGNFD